MRKKRLTQKDKVLAHLMAGDPISPMEAIRDYGITRLAAIIHELKADHHITATRVNTCNRFNERRSYAVYRMPEHVRYTEKAAESEPATREYAAGKINELRGLL